MRAMPSPRRALVSAAVPLALAVAGAPSLAQETPPEAVPAPPAPVADDAPPEPIPPTPPDCRISPSLLRAGSLAVGRPFRGRLVRGVTYPQDTSYSFSWDFPNAWTPSPAWRRAGTERLVLSVRCVAFRHARARPGGPRVGVADLSRPRGGRFGAEYGGLGHGSHQNGLDVDILYPRRDGAEAPPDRVADIDVPAAQALVSAFVRAGAQYVFVSPALHGGGRLRGPGRIVRPLVHHDDHLHVRLRPSPADRAP